jgi:hypothetical protein
MNPPAPDSDTPGGFFEGLVRWPWAGSDTLMVPAFLEDFSTLAVLHTADARAVAALLPDRRLRVIDVAPGRCLFQVVAVDYRKSDFGSYREIACAVPVAIAEPRLPATGLASVVPALDALARGLARSFTAWVWRLPVSTERARDAGLTLANFPKALADVRFGPENGATAASLHGDDGQLVLRLALPSGASGRRHDGIRDLRLRAVTMVRGQPVTSLLRLREIRWLDLPRPEAPVLTLGQGELADALRGLGLGDRPWFAHHAERAQAVLFPPRNLLDD